jgi:leucyl/phenylalanyl-tRNA--protein transferase
MQTSDFVSVNWDVSRLLVQTPIGQSSWSIPTPQIDDTDLIGLGADLAPETLIAAYKSGLFPMPVDKHIGWWSPNPRGILRPDQLKVSRSLRKSCSRFEIRLNSAFSSVVEACADPSREGAWINDNVATAYQELHRLGWAHSVETWDLASNQLVGGLYGVCIGSLFAGESMFSHVTDASKVALVGLVDVLCAGSSAMPLIDVQWQTPHLQSLGVAAIGRDDYIHEIVAHATNQAPSTLVQQAG